MADITRFAIPLIDCFPEVKKRGSDRDRQMDRRGDPETAGVEEASGDKRENMLVAAVQMRRRGYLEAQFREAVLDSVVDIVNTVDLQSSVDLRGLEYVSRSVLNYGIYDLTHLTSEDARLAMVEQNVTAALINFEPRIQKETVQVRRETVFNDVTQSLRLSIYAEVDGNPIKVPVEFVAEVDMSLGKINISGASKLP